jgi:hypothetical protein
MFGGKCHGLQIVEEGYGSNECRECNSNTNGYCEVEIGQEKTTLCPIVEEFINFNEIKLWNPRL